MQNFCTLKDYANFCGCTLRTAYNHFYSGRLPGAFKNPMTGKGVFVPMHFIQGHRWPDVVIYATVTKNRKNYRQEMEEEVRRLKIWCNLKGYTVKDIVREYSPTIVEERPKFFGLLKDRTIKHIVAASPASTSRFGHQYIETLLKCDDREITYVDPPEKDAVAAQKDLMDIVLFLLKKFSKKNVDEETVRKSLLHLGLSELRKPRPDKRKKTDKTDK